MRLKQMQGGNIDAVPLEAGGVEAGAKTFKSMTVKQLKKKAKSRGLKASGKRSAIIARLRSKKSKKSSRKGRRSAKRSMRGGQVGQEAMNLVEAIQGGEADAIQGGEVETIQGGARRMSKAHGTCSKYKISKCGLHPACKVVRSRRTGKKLCKRRSKTLE